MVYFLSTKGAENATATTESFAEDQGQSRNGSRRETSGVSVCTARLSHHTVQSGMSDRYLLYTNGQRVCLSCACGDHGLGLTSGSRGGSRIPSTVSSVSKRWRKLWPSMTLQRSSIPIRECSLHQRPSPPSLRKRGS